MLAGQGPSSLKSTRGVTQMKTIARTAALIVGVAGLLSAGAVVAADAPARAGPGHHREGGWRPDPKMQAQRLHDLLQLRPEQDAAAAAFVAASARQPRPPRPERPDGPSRALTTPERLDREAGKIGELTARMQARIQATRVFYAQLTPAQQKAFDALDLGRRGHGRPAMHRFGGPGGGFRGGPDGSPPPSAG